MFGPTERRVSYEHMAEGIWGEFRTTAGRVAFLMTKARLSSGGSDEPPDLEGRLTRLLAPVREVLAIERMNFNQLLQRDLDDHRVATELLPYVLQPSSTGPAFFPPILAALLPFRQRRTATSFPPEEHLPVVPDDEFGHFEEWRYGNAYRFQRLVGADGGITPVRFGRVSWNGELTKLVVLDGQHRAMALLAVERTVDSAWTGSTGNKYRHFYEHRVNRLLKHARASGTGLDLAHVEYPVTICWFPDYHGAERNPHKAARKLFVDVNKNAKKPSKARLVLLSDDELCNVLTRSILNELRGPDSPFPLYVIEYDSPDAESSRPVRWSVMSNVNILRTMVEKCSFGPDKYIRDVALRFGGRVSASEMDSYFRKELGIRDLLPSEIEEDDFRTISRDSLGNEIFPQHNKTARDAVVNRFQETWGSAILRVLSDFAPFRAHIHAADELSASWTHSDSVASLAYDAVFEGVGMYWTLRASHQHWQTKIARGEAFAKPDVAKAWDVVEDKGRSFKVLRTVHYLGSSTAEATRECEALYDAVNTHACQVGLIMTLASLRYHHAALKLAPAGLAEIVVRAWNAALEGGPVASRNRRLLLSKGCKHPLNMIRKMDSPHAVYFRYFLLQLLEAPEARSVWEGHLDPEVVAQLVATARRPYFKYLLGEKLKALTRTEPLVEPAKRQEKAREDVADELAQSLFFWFKFPRTDFKSWLDAGGPEPASRAAGSEVEGDDDRDVADMDERDETADTADDDDTLAELDEVLDEG